MTGFALWALLTLPDTGFAFRLETHEARNPALARALCEQAVAAERRAAARGRYIGLFKFRCVPAGRGA